MQASRWTMRLGWPLALVLGLAPSARAQVEEPRPYFYLWAAPSGGYGSALTDFASQIVRVKVDLYSTPGACATAVANAARSQIAAGVTDEDHVCILLQNFGNNIGSYPIPFLHDDDELDPLPDPVTTEPYPADGDSMQPWMAYGIQDATVWMEDFLDQYEEEMSDPTDPAPEPVRFHFDTEVFLSGCCLVNFTRILEAVSLDDRWDTAYVPGFPTQTTMADLWEQAKDAFGWGDALMENVDRFEAPNSDQNRPFFLWYYQVVQAARAGAMWEAAYQPIWARFPNCKVSNYYDTNADGERDRSGWYTGRDWTDDPYPTGQTSLIASNQFARGATNRFGTGAQYYWNDAIFDEGGANERPTLWLTEPGVTPADFSAPVLYPYQKPHWDSSSRKNYYLRYNPQVTIPDITLANGRRWVEAILNSTPGHGPAEVAPWIYVPYSNWDLNQGGAGGAYNYTTTATEVRLLMAMLRAKSLDEVILWWKDTPNDPYPDWDMLKALMDQVWVPQLASYEVTLGNTVSSPYDEDRLRYTLRESPTADEVLEIEADNPNETQFNEVVLEVTYDNLDDWAEEDQMALNLELSLLDAEEGDVDDVRGLVYVWDSAEAEWVRVESTDDFGSSDPGFGFFAPEDDDHWYETRRTFQLPASITDANTMDVKIVLRRPVASELFTARFDLTQLVGAPDLFDEIESFAQGGDFDHSQAVNTTDLAGFMAAYTAGKPLADFNNDGQLTIDDVIAFGARYNP